MNEINDMLRGLKMQAWEQIEEALGLSTIDLDNSAYLTKAIERTGDTSNAKLLLQLLLLYATSNLSLRAIAVCAYAMNAVNVSDEAWRQRFSKCGAWLFLLLHTALHSIAPPTLVFYYDGKTMQTYLLDTTTFKQVGKNGEELRVHLCYNLTKGAMEEVVVTDNHTAESTKHFTIKPGNLYMADAGYGKGVNMEYVSSRGGYALFRISPNLVQLCSDSKGKNRIDMEKKLKGKKKLLNFQCFVHTSRGRYIPVRVMASKLPEDKALLAMERKRRNASKKQTQLKGETLVYCQWVILMTNVSENHTAKSLLQLYRSRWQIELLFKRIKQFFKIKRLKKANLQLSKILVMLWILIWSAIERKSLELEIRLLIQGEDMQRYSLWVPSMLLIKQFEAMLNALWAFFLDFSQDLSTLYRLMRNHKSRRRNQYAGFRFASPFVTSLPVSEDKIA